MSLYLHFEIIKLDKKNIFTYYIKLSFQIKRFDDIGISP